MFSLFSDRTKSARAVVQWIIAVIKKIPSATSEDFLNVRIAVINLLNEVYSKLPPKKSPDQKIKGSLVRCFSCINT
jgi:hypothetical protein